MDGSHGGHPTTPSTGIFLKSSEGLSATGWGHGCPGLSFLITQGQSLDALRHVVVMAMGWKPEAGGELKSIYDPNNLHLLCSYDDDYDAVIANIY